MTPQRALLSKTAKETIFGRAWEHFYKFYAGTTGKQMHMDFVVSFARKEVLRDRRRRKR